MHCLTRGKGLTQFPRTRKKLRRGVFTNVASLEETALDHIDASSDDAKPFVWPADAPALLLRLMFESFQPH